MRDTEHVNNNLVLGMMPVAKVHTTLKNFIAEVLRETAKDMVNKRNRDVGSY